MESTLHSRHIPREHLDFSVSTARTVEANGLCGVLEGDMPARLLERGISVIETRFTWYEAGDPASPDLSMLERRIAAIEKAGLRPGLFCWLQYPPEGYGDISYLRCLEHGEGSSIASLWDPRLLKVYDDIMNSISARFGARLRFLYVGIFGDYGEVCFPGGVRHYRFSPRHGHRGLWCADQAAQADFRAWLQERYGSLPPLCEAWETEIESWESDLMPALPLELCTRRRQIDFMLWYTGSITRFCGAVCALAEKHFPGLRKGLPIGFVDEPLEVGQWKSEIVRTAAAFGMTARWTGMGFLKDFARSDVPAKRISCAARFYGTSFGTEAALVLERENAGNAAYECIANQSVLIHNDPGNVLRGGELWQELIRHMRLSPPIQTTGVYWPVEGEMLSLLDPGEETQKFDDDDGVCGSGEEPPSAVNALILRCAALRRRMDYAIFDTPMVEHGFLAGLERVLFLISCPVPETVCRAIEEFEQAGGEVWRLSGVRLTVLESDRIWKTPKMHTTDEIPAPEEFQTLRRRYDREERRYFTIHRDFVSCFDPLAAAAGDAEAAVRYYTIEE